jgi:hypothetical protein
VRFALAGDLLSAAGSLPTPAQSILLALEADKELDFAVFLGDTLSKGSEEILAGFASEFEGEIAYAPGSSEYGDRSLRGLLSFEKLTRRGRRELGLPFSERALSASEVQDISPDPLGRWFSFRVGSVLVMVLDGEASEAEGLQEQLVYARRVLALAELPRTGVDIRHVVVALHRSPFSGYAKEEPKSRDALLSVLALSPKVRAVFSAHAKSYERFVLSRARDGAPLPDVLFGVLGTGGAPTVDPAKKASIPGASYATPDGRLDLTLSGSFSDPDQGNPSSKKPVFGYGLVELSPQGDISYQFVQIPGNGAPTWKQDQCSYGGGLIRWNCAP